MARAWFVMKYRHLSFASISFILRNFGLRYRAPRILHALLSGLPAGRGQTARLFGIIAILGLFTTACTAGHGSGSPSASNDDWPFEQSSRTQSPPAGDALAANPDGNRPAQAQSGQDGVYSGSAFPSNTGGGACVRKERISDFRVDGTSVRWRAFRGTIRNNRLRMVHGNTWITGQFTGDRFNGQIVMLGQFGEPRCTFAVTLDRTGP